MTTIIKDSLAHFRTNLKINDTDGSVRSERLTAGHIHPEQAQGNVRIQDREPLFASPLSVEQASILAANIALNINDIPTTALLAHRPSSNVQALLSDTLPETV